MNRVSKHRAARRRWSLLLVGSIVAVLALGWFADALAQTPTRATNTSGVQTQQAGLYSVTLTLTPTAPHAGGDVTIRLGVRDVSGAPVTGATVSYALTMSAMDMPGGAGLTQAVGAGVYQVSGGFSMSGVWALRVGVTPPAHNGHTQATVYTTFTIVVR
ncbi:MAG: FixH family protein [Ktedonobacterales bacterium]